MTVAQRSSAADMLERKGQTVTIAGVSSATYNTATGGTTPTAYSKTAKAALLPLSPFRKFAGADVKPGDENLILAGLDTSGAALPEPPINSIITLADGTTKRTLIALEVIRPAGLNIIYDCAVRGYA